MSPAGAARAATLLLALAPCVSLAKGSELDAETKRVFPYDGTLEYGGNAHDGAVDLFVTVTDGSSCTYTETQSSVNVFGGRFSLNVGAGSSAGVSACVFNAAAVYIRFSVRQAGTGSFVALNGSQRIRPVPFAYWAAEGADLWVDGTVAASGAATVGGNLTVRGSTLTIGTATTAIPGRSTLVHGTGDKLTLSPGKSGATLTVEGATTIKGDASAATLTASGTLDSPNAPGLAGTGTATTAARSDHTHAPACPSGTTVDVVSNGSRLCAWKYTGNVNYSGASEQCWLQYGAELCSYNQVRLMCSDAIGKMRLSTNHWMRDRNEDDESIYTNGTDCEDFDGVKSHGSTLSGAYCCTTRRF